MCMSLRCGHEGLDYIASKFEFSNFSKEIKLQLIINKYVDICFCNLLFVNFIFLPRII